MGRSRYYLKWRKHYLESFARIPDGIALDEKVILAFVDNAEVKTVLDAGYQWYNLHHARQFSGKRYHTIEIDSSLAKFGARHHVTGSFLDAREHYQRHQFDLVLMNGVFGWGVDSEAQLRKAAAVLEHIVRPGGYVVIGWNDHDENRPAICPSELLHEAFEPADVCGMGSRCLVNPESKHLFAFFKRR